MGLKGGGQVWERKWPEEGPGATGSPPRQATSDGYGKGGPKARSRGGHPQPPVLGDPQYFQPVVDSGLKHT